jgi:predicted lipoprotein with Yx(FWY)xxD motif
VVPKGLWCPLRLPTPWILIAKSGVNRTSEASRRSVLPGNKREANKQAASHLDKAEGVSVNNKAFITAVVLAAAALIAAILGDASSAASQKGPKGALISIHKTSLGRVIADARGHTLYLFEKDKNRMSSCNGACLVYWPGVLTSAKPRAGAGVRASLLGVTKRADGRLQVTYAGHPLYRFVGDTKPGQTTGEGLTDFGAAWDAIAANGRPVEPTAPASAGSGNGAGW